MQQHNYYIDQEMVLDSNLPGSNYKLSSEVRDENDIENGWKNIQLKIENEHHHLNGFDINYNL